MSTILKEDILRGKSVVATGKEKVDKIMDKIAEPSGTSKQARLESAESKLTSEPVKATENVVKEYIFSNEILIEGEDKSDLDDIGNRIRKELKPSNEIESIIVDRIVSSIWRLKRCLKIESQIMEYLSSCIQEYDQGFFRTRKRTHKELTQLKALKIAEDKNKVEDLSKYETMLERQIYRALSELNKVRQRDSRQGKKTLKKSK